VKNNPTLKPSNNVRCNSFSSKFNLKPASVFHHYKCTHGWRTESPSTSQHKWHTQTWVSLVSHLFSWLRIILFCPDHISDRYITMFTCFISDQFSAIELLQSAVQSLCVKSYTLWVSVQYMCRGTEIPAMSRWIGSIQILVKMKISLSISNSLYSWMR